MNPDPGAVCLQGKLVQVLDVESMGFPSLSEEKISLSEQKRQGQLSKHARPLRPSVIAQLFALRMRPGRAGSLSNQAGTCWQELAWTFLKQGPRGWERGAL